MNLNSHKLANCLVRLVYSKDLKNYSNTPKLLSLIMPLTLKKLVGHIAFGSPVHDSMCPSRFLAHLYESTGRAIAVTTVSASALHKILKGFG